MLFVTVYFSAAFSMSAGNRLLLLPATLPATVLVQNMSKSVKGLSRYNKKCELLS